MGRCNNCHIKVKDNVEVCPLCRCVLNNDETGHNAYPNIIRHRRKLQLAARIYLFLAIITELVLIYLNYRFLPAYKWSVIPGCLMACTYLTLYYLERGTGFTYGMDLIIGAVALVFMVDLSDKLLGDYGWSMNYVQPGLLMAVNVILLIMILVNRRGWQGYIVTQLVILILSLCAIPLVLAGQVTHPLVSVIAIGTSVVFFIGTLIIGGPRAKEELIRRFHI